MVGWLADERYIGGRHGNLRTRQQLFDTLLGYMLDARRPNYNSLNRERLRAEDLYVASLSETFRSEPHFPNRLLSMLRAIEDRSAVSCSWADYDSEFTFFVECVVLYEGCSADVGRKNPLIRRLDTAVEGVNYLGAEVKICLKVLVNSGFVIVILYVPQMIDGVGKNARFMSH